MTQNETEIARLEGIRDIAIAAKYFDKADELQAKVGTWLLTYIILASHIRATNAHARGFKRTCSVIECSLLLAATLPLPLSICQVTPDTPSPSLA